jgi:hypothetical protein
MIIENKIEIIESGAGIVLEEVIDAGRLAMKNGFGGVNIAGFFIEKIFDLHIEYPPISPINAIVNLESVNIQNLVNDYYKQCSGNRIHRYNVGINAYDLSSGDLEAVYRYLEKLNNKEKTRIFLDLGTIAEEIEVVQILNYCQELDFPEVVFHSTLNPDFEDELVYEETVRLTRKMKIPIGLWVEFESIPDLALINEECNGTVMVEYGNLLEMLE